MKRHGAVGAPSSAAFAAEPVTGARAKALTRRPKGSGTVFREGEFYRARMPGKARQSVALEETYERAAEKLDAALQAVGACRAPERVWSVWQWIAQCLEWREAEGMGDVQNERWKLALHVGEDPAGRIPIVLFTADDAIQWVARVCCKGGGGRGRKVKSQRQSRRSIVNLLALVRGAFDRAVARRLLKENPFALVGVPKGVRDERKETEESYPGVLDGDEQLALLSAASGEIELFQAALRTALGTAIRKGELFQLRWENVFLDVREPYVLTRYGSPDRGKTKQRRVQRVPLFGIALAALRAWREICAPGGAHRNDSVNLGGANPGARIGDVLAGKVGKLGQVGDEVQRIAPGDSGAESIGDEHADELAGSAHPETIEGGIGREVHGLAAGDGIILMGARHAPKEHGAGAEGKGGPGRSVLTGLLFPGPRGERIKPFRAAWERCLAKAGIARHCTWHDLRHTCATSLLEGWWGEAWAIEEVRQFLRHADTKTTERYLHARGSLMFARARKVRGDV